MLSFNYLHTLSIPIVHHSFIIPISFLYPNPTLFTPFFHQKFYFTSFDFLRFFPLSLTYPICSTSLTYQKTIFITLIQKYNSTPDIEV